MQNEVIGTDLGIDGDRESGMTQGLEGDDDAGRGGGDCHGGLQEVSPGIVNGHITQKEVLVFSAPPPSALDR